MKYRQLTKEQFLELHQEFAHFLATQQIDASEWDVIKKDNPSLAEEEMNIFSDVVWEKVLTETAYLEHFTENHINLFECSTSKISRIYIQLKDTKRNFLDATDFQWFLNNPLAESIEYFKGSKNYSKERNVEIFELIEMGSHISKGDLFNTISELIP